MDRRHFVAGSAAAAATSAMRPAFAQDAYPSHAITFINPFPPGGAADVVGRPLVAMLEPILKQPCVIETKAGAAGQVGAQVAATRKAGRLHAAHPYRLDLRLCRSRQAVRPPAEVHARRFHSDRAAHVADPWCCWSTTRQPYKTVKELVDDAKKRPDKIIFSSSGLYGALHLPTALFMKAAGIKMQHLPTNGGGPALTAILGNNSQVLVSSIAAASGQIKAGKLRALAMLRPDACSLAPQTCRP